jgi:hypothetical protein
MQNISKLLFKKVQENKHFLVTITLYFMNDEANGTLNRPAESANI